MKRIKSKDGDVFMIDRIRGTGEYVIRISHIKGNEYNYQAVITSDFATKMIEAMLEEINDPRSE